MSHVFRVPEDLYAAIIAFAAEQGETPDQLFLQWAHSIKDQRDRLAATGDQPMDMSGATYVPANDPLAEFLGAFETDVPDLVIHHDHYLGEAYGDDHKFKS